jgi:hypothetical protein
VSTNGLVYNIGKATDNNDATPVMLQDFRIYPYVLSAAQITSLQSGSTTIPQSLMPISEPYQLERWRDSSTYNDGTKFIYYNTGYVGIGRVPTVALHVNAATSSVTSNMRYFSCNLPMTFTNNSNLTNICAQFDTSIWCKSVIAAASDSRIKKNISDIDDNTALDMIMAIQPKTYNYIDPNKGVAHVYGFLAQQIKEVIPQAVQIRKDVIPNIFAVAYAYGNRLTFKNTNVSDYGRYINSKLCIVYMSGEYDNVVITGIDDNAIIIDKNMTDDTKVFVYGTEVDDFHVLDKSYIFTLNVCATQLLARQIDELEKEVTEIENMLNV